MIASGKFAAICNRQQEADTSVLSAAKTAP